MREKWINHDHEKMMKEDVRDEGRGEEERERERRHFLCVNNGD